MDTRIARAASLEFEEAIAYYESQQEGLGVKFREAVAQTVGEIARAPFLSSPGVRQIRERMTRRFPYKIIYRVYPEHIFIVAIMHVSRRPGYWRARMMKR